ncbi:hypothetical protein ES708_12451 [subsurface metagenome]
MMKNIEMVEKTCNKTVRVIIKRNGKVMMRLCLKHGRNKHLEHLRAVGAIKMENVTGNLDGCEAFIESRVKIEGE